MPNPSHRKKKKSDPDQTDGNQESSSVRGETPKKEEKSARRSRANESGSSRDVIPQSNICENEEKSARGGRANESGSSRDVIPQSKPSENERTEKASNQDVILRPEIEEQMEVDLDVPTAGVIVEADAKIPEEILLREPTPPSSRWANGPPPELRIPKKLAVPTPENHLSVKETSPNRKRLPSKEREPRPAPSSNGKASAKKPCRLFENPGKSFRDMAMDMNKERLPTKAEIRKNTLEWDTMKERESGAKQAGRNRHGRRIWSTARGNSQGSAEQKGYATMDEVPPRKQGSRPIPENGYRNQEFVRSLLPQKQDGTNLFSFMTLDAALQMRQETAAIMKPIDNGFPVSPRRENPDRVTEGWTVAQIKPVDIEGKKPVLFQVVSKQGGKLLCEAKDFALFLPDRRDLTYIIIDHFGTNVLEGIRGVLVDQVSLKDFFWVYSLELAFHIRDVISYRKNLEECTATCGRWAHPENPTVWRARHYSPVLGDDGAVSLLGYVMIQQHNKKKGTSDRMFLAVQGSSTPAILSKSFFDFLPQRVTEGDVVSIKARANVSTAIRLSEPPSSREGYDMLLDLIREQVPALNSDVIMPMSVSVPPKELGSFTNDLLDQFTSYSQEKESGFQNLSAVYGLASSALSTGIHMQDDRNAHLVTVTCANTEAFPMSLETVVSDIESLRNWAEGRKASLIFKKYSHTESISCTARVHTARLDSRNKQLTLELQIDRGAGRVANRFRRSNSRSGLVALLHQLPENMELSPEFTEVAGMQLFSDLPADSTAMEILDCLFHRTGDKPEVTVSGAVVDSVIFKGKEVRLTEEQKQTIRMMGTPVPVQAVQASPGSGKTFTAAVFLSLQLRGDCGTVVALAVTNAAVAALAEKLSELAEMRGAAFVRFVAESTRANTDVKPFDLTERLKQLKNHPKVKESGPWKETIRRFTKGREILEAYSRKPEDANNATEDDRLQVVAADREAGGLITRATAIYFAVNPPKLILATIGSFLRLTGEDGLFEKRLQDISLICCNEASQIAECCIPAISSRAPSARQVFIGDNNQMSPYCTLPEDSLPAKTGAKSVLQSATESAGVLESVLSTNFRSQPELVEMANYITYKGEMSSGVPEGSRDRLLNIISFPASRTPIAFIETDNFTQIRTKEGSYFNEVEATMACHLIDALMERGVAPDEIFVLCFYKEQQQLLETKVPKGVAACTVDLT